MAQAFGNIVNREGSQRIQGTTDDYLRSIAENMASLKREHVPPFLFKKQKWASLGIGEIPPPIVCDGIAVYSVTAQVFTTGGILSLFFSSGISPTDTPDFQVQTTPFPVTFYLPGFATDLTVRNDSGTTIAASVFLSSVQ